RHAGPVELVPGFERLPGPADAPGVDRHVVAPCPQAVCQSLRLEAAAAHEIGRVVPRHQHDPHAATIEGVPGGPVPPALRAQTGGVPHSWRDEGADPVWWRGHPPARSRPPSATAPAGASTSPTSSRKRRSVWGTACSSPATSSVTTTSSCTWATT